MDTPAHEVNGEVYRQWGHRLRSEIYRLCKDSPYDFADYSLLGDFPGASLDDLSIVMRTSQYEKDGIIAYFQCAAGEENAHGVGKLSRNSINLVTPEYTDEAGTPVLSRWLGVGINEISGQIGFVLRDIRISRAYSAEIDQPFDARFSVRKLMRLPEIEDINNLIGNEDPLELQEYAHAIVILESLSAEDAVKPSYIEEGL